MDTEYTKNIICPYCGREQEKKSDKDEGFYMDCEWCGESFEVESYGDGIYTSISLLDE